MKTAEEILCNKWNCERENLQVDIILSANLTMIIESMEEYAKLVAIGFLDSIRDYEKENGQRICFDERTSKELFNEFIKQTSGGK